MNRWMTRNVRLPLLLLAACLWMLCRHEPAAAAPRPVSCTAVGQLAPSSDVASAIALQKNTQTGPLYQMLASKARRATCSVTFQEPGKFKIDYRFGNHGWLHLKRDARIEYTQWTVRFTGALKEPAQALLARSERWNFGPDGCRIDWSESEILAAEDDASANETIYRGAVCNCQARIRRNAHGRVDGFTLASAC